MQVLAEELKCDVNEIADFDLGVYDTQPGTLGGVRNDFVFAGRLDTWHQPIVHCQHCLIPVQNLHL